MDRKERIALDLEDARRRTHELLGPVDEVRLTTQHDPLLSPLIWDYGHIGVFEELWLVSNISDAPPVDEHLLHAYDAIENPRHTRRRLELMDRPTTLSYLERVRGRALALLDEVDLEGDDPLLRDGYVYDLTIQHEYQHDETICQTLQLLPGGYLSELPALPAGRDVREDMVTIPGGRYPIGHDRHEPYDNEQARHDVELRPFALDRFPVTNGQFLAFMQDGGYSRQELWSRDGWEWICAFGTEAPEYWFCRDGEWFVDRFGRCGPVDTRVPVMHVCYFEAEAYARWAGKRLPTEFEWEVGASFDPATGDARRHPWGDEAPTAEHANLDHRLFAPAPVGSYARGTSPLGCEQMLGDVWEWTSSDFQAYPGFSAFPYAEYSTPFFGSQFKVLRGGSWATRPSVARATFRNWDSPIKRQIFAGFRCARGVA